MRLKGLIGALWLHLFARQLYLPNLELFWILLYHGWRSRKTLSKVALAPQEVNEMSRTTAKFILGFECRTVALYRAVWLSVVQWRLDGTPPPLWLEQPFHLSTGP